MKTEVLEKLADLLDTVEDVHCIDEETNDMVGFSMEDYFHHHEDESCDTPSCIAGHLVWMIKGKPDSFRGIDFEAGQLAGLNLEIRSELFTPDTNCNYELKSPWDVTAKEAAKVIRNLVKTGKVDWTIVCGNMVEET